MAKTRFLADFRVGKVDIHYPNYFPIFLFPHTKKKLISILYTFPCRILLRSLCLTIDSGGHITQLMFYFTTMEAHILLGYENMATTIFVADGLKEFRRTDSINDGVIIRFFALDKNTSFEVDVMGPIHGQPTGRSVVTTKRHIFTTDATPEMVQLNLPLQLLQIICLAQKNIFMSTVVMVDITIHDGLPSLAESWFQYQSENNLMLGDEVVFFFKFDEHAWELLFRKEVVMISNKGNLLEGKSVSIETAQQRGIFAKSHISTMGNRKSVSTFYNFQYFPFIGAFITPWQITREITMGLRAHRNYHFWYAISSWNFPDLMVGTSWTGFFVLSNFFIIMGLLIARD
ncbi:hypothetical protein HKD37_15G043500 [Glycine soja]